VTLLSYRVVNAFVRACIDCGGRTTCFFNKGFKYPRCSSDECTRHGGMINIDLEVALKHYIVLKSGPD
jgi:hypothetical protein